MALSVEDIGEIDHVVGQWCLNRVPPQLKKSVDYDYEIDGQAVTIIEVRPSWQGSPGEMTRRPIARFRFFKVTGQWQIYWMRSSGKWQWYEPMFEATELDDALMVIETNQHG